MSDKYSFKTDPSFPGAQPFRLNGTPNKTKKRSNMIIFKTHQEKGKR